MKYKILLADDEKHIRISFKERLKEHKNIDPVFVSNTKDAINTVRKSPFDFAVIVLDFHFTGEKLNGADVARELYKINPKLLILIFTSDESVEIPIECLRAGVNDFIHKGKNLDDAIKKISDYCKKYDETYRLYNPILDEDKKYQKNRKLIETIGMVGRSDSLASVAEQIININKTNSDVTVLIRGESGTGKELIADALHRMSPRKDHKIIKINCGSIPANLLESELFGHEKGAFTGANNKKIGKFQIASNGTIFLDEIGDMPYDLQVKLLRVLQEKTIEPIGSNVPIKVNVRVIAATHVDLEEAIEKKKFREDLYYRLNVIPIMIEPLRLRREDIEPLVMFFKEKFINSSNTKFLYKTMLYLKSYNWKGNVRELENSIKRILTLYPDQMITPEHLEGKFFSFDPNDVKDFDYDYPTFKKELDALISKKEKDYFEYHYSRENSIRATAKKLLMPNATLQVKLKEFSIADNRE